MRNGLTIFTPTYNREKTLPRLYKSLLNQTNTNFEWLVVDDGSIDKTKKIIDTWIKENKIKIRYIYQENHGKTFAHNVGAENALLEWFLCLDSDDFLTNNAVEIILKSLNLCPDNCIGLISARKNIKSKNSFKNVKLSNGKLITFEELYRKYKYKGDTCIVYKTKLLRKNLFPIFENEKFVPEQYLHDCMQEEGKLFYLDNEVYCCEYLADGYTNNTKNLLRNNPKGLLEAGKNRVKKAKFYRSKFRGAIQVNIACFILKTSVLKEIKKFKWSEKTLVCLSSIVAYLHYKRKYE